MFAREGAAAAAAISCGFAAAVEGTGTAASTQTVEDAHLRAAPLCSQVPLAISSTSSQHFLRAEEGQLPGNACFGNALGCIQMQCVRSWLAYCCRGSVVLLNDFLQLEDVDYFREIAWPRLQPLLTAKEIQVDAVVCLVSQQLKG